MSKSRLLRISVLSDRWVQWNLIQQSDSSDCLFNWKIEIYYLRRFVRGCYQSCSAMLITTEFPTETVIKYQCIISVDFNFSHGMFYVEAIETFENSNLKLKTFHVFGSDLYIILYNLSPWTNCKLHPFYECN